MVPAYRTAANQMGMSKRASNSTPGDNTTIYLQCTPGTGKAERQRDIVYGRITNGTLFPNMSLSAKTDTKEMTRSKFKRLSKTIEEHLSSLPEDLEMTLGNIQDKDMGEDEDKSKFAEVQFQLTKKMDVVQAVVTKIVATVSEY
jgi:hypothetical protein